MRRIQSCLSRCPKIETPLGWCDLPVRCAVIRGHRHRHLGLTRFAATCLALSTPPCRQHHRRRRGDVQHQGAALGLREPGDGVHDAEDPSPGQRLLRVSLGTVLHREPRPAEHPL